MRNIKFKNFLLLFFLTISFSNLYALEKVEILEVSRPPYDSAFNLELGYFNPLGYYAQLINSAPMLKASWRYNPKWWDYFVLEAEAGLAFSDFKNNPGVGYSFLPLALQGVYLYPLDPTWSLFAGLGVGYYLMTIEGEQFRNFHAQGAIALQLELSYNLKAYVKEEIFLLNDAREPLWASGTFLGLQYVFGEPLAEKDVKISSVATEKIFTALYPVYYQENVGVIQLENTAGEELYRVKVSVWIDGYMNNKSVSPVQPERVGKDQKILIPVYLYFNKKIKQLGSDLFTTATLELEYEKKNGVKYRKKENMKFKIFGRNALIWDNLSKLGSFISYNDPAVFDFTRRILALPSKDEALGASPELVNLIKVVEGLRLYQLSYVKDPQTPYESFSSQKAMVDSIQYPRETLLKKTGDCDDLSVLLSAMLESIGINTAFVTTPGHIFLLVEVPGSPYPTLTIHYQGKKWLPIESTKIAAGFAGALNAGYENYRRAPIKEMVTAGQARAKYPPLTFEEPLQVNFAYGDLGNGVKQELGRVASQAAKELTSGELNKFSAAELNSKAVNYSRLGLLKEAEMIYQFSIKKFPKYKPPYYNLVTLYSLEKDFGSGKNVIQDFKKEFGDLDEKMQESERRINLELASLKNDSVQQKSDDNEKLELLMLRSYY